MQLYRTDALLLAASQNSIAGLLTGLIVFAIFAGTVGLGTVFAYLLHNSSKNKWLAIAIVVAMSACGGVLAYTLAEPLHVFIGAWLGRE